MLSVCGYNSLKQFYTSRHKTWYGKVLAAPLLTPHGPSSHASVIPQPKGYESVDRHKSKTEIENGLDSLSPLRRNQNLPGKRKCTAKALHNKQPLHKIFAQLSDLIGNGNVRGTTLWCFVEEHFPPVRFRLGDAFTGPQQSLISQVLRIVLDEWTTRGTSWGDNQLLTVLRGYRARKFMRREDWAHCLQFLARITYQNINLHRDQPLQEALVERISDANHLRVLCKAWMLFLNSGPMTGSSRGKHPWLEFQDKMQDQAPDTGNGADYIQRFVSYTATQNSFTDPNLDRHLAYASILTLVAFYSSMRTFFIGRDDGQDRKRCNDPGNDASISEGDIFSTPRPNWHLGPGQSTYWTPEIGHLSVSEASILYVITQAAKGATLNLTLLRIMLTRMSLAESDVQQIAKIYQSFKLALPAIMAKFQDFAHDATVYDKRHLRRHPFQVYVQKAVASNDIEALEHAGYGGAAKAAPCDSLALVKAFLRTDRPSRALCYWNVLAQRADLPSQAWLIWSDYAFQKNDQVAFETVWDKLWTLGMRSTSKLWYQRLLLLHQANQSSSAWTHFCTLIRSSGRNQILVGRHDPQIAPPVVDIRIFHMMIQAYLEQETGPGAKVARAKETFELLKKQEGVEATRETYMLFIESLLRRGARQPAIEWFLEGKSMQIKFLPGDYGLIFEHDLVRHDKDQPGPLSDPSTDVRHCIDAISAIMRLARDHRVSTESGYQASFPSSLPTSDIQSVLRSLPVVDNVDDDLEDPNAKETQSLYAGLMQHLAQRFAEQPSGIENIARLRLLLLLWDHCVLTGTPASSQMESILRSTVCSMKPGLQAKLMRGDLFNNYDADDPLSSHSYRYMRLIGRHWLSNRITSIPQGPARSQLARLPWSGYDAMTETALVEAGIASQEDRRKILDEIMSWKNAPIKRAEAAKKKKELEFKSLAKSFDDMAAELRCQVEQQADQISNKEQTISKLKKDLQAARINMDTERRAGFKLVRFRGIHASIEESTDLAGQCTQG